MDEQEKVPDVETSDVVEDLEPEDAETDEVSGGAVDSFMEVPHPRTDRQLKVMRLPSSSDEATNPG